MSADLLRRLIGAALGLAAAGALARQCRKPTWWLGRLVTRSMNVRHSSVTDWGLSHVSIERSFTILDVGCGGGRTIQKLAAAAVTGKVYGIDYSQASVDVARATNAELIEAGRVDIQQGTVSHLPFPPDTFDVVTAVETHYYWPAPDADLREIRRVMKPGGRVAIIAETYKGRRFDALFRPAMALLGAHYLTLSEHRDWFAAAGLVDVEVFEERRKGWICVVGREPAVA